MKAEYSKPEIEVIEVEVNEVMASSDPEAQDMENLRMGGEKQSWSGLDWD